MVANAQCLAHVVVGDEHANATLFEEADDALDLDHGDGVNAGKRLVQQDETRLGRQRPRNLDPAALPAGQRQRRRAAQMVHAQVLQQARQPQLNLGLVQRRARARAFGIALQLQHGAHIVFHVELAENRGLLRQIAQAQPRPAVNWHALNGIAINCDVARAGPHQAHNHVKRRCFARPIGAQQAHNLALADHQRHVFNDLPAAIKFLQMGYFKPALAVRCAGPHVG